MDPRDMDTWLQLDQEAASAERSRQAYAAVQAARQG